MQAKNLKQNTETSTPIALGPYHNTADVAELPHSLRTLPKPIDGDEPVPLEVTVSYSGSVKVAIEEYGKKTADAGVFVSRKYAVPPHWNEQQIKTFEIGKILDLKDELEPILQEDHDSFMAQRKFR